MVNKKSTRLKDKITAEEAVFLVTEQELKAKGLRPAPKAIRLEIIKARARACGVFLNANPDGSYQLPKAFKSLHKETDIHSLLLCWGNYRRSNHIAEQEKLQIATDRYNTREFYEQSLTYSDITEDEVLALDDFLTNYLVNPLKSLELQTYAKIRYQVMLEPRDIAEYLDTSISRVKKLDVRLKAFIYFYFTVFEPQVN